MRTPKQIEKEENQTSDYYAALLKQKENENQSLQAEVKRLSVENQSIMASFSFKIGALVTFPIRALLSLFNLKKKAKINPIKASCDSALSLLDIVEISGWALSDGQIEKIEVYLAGKMVGLAEQGIKRSDVARAFPDNPWRNNSGFYFRYRQKLKTDEVLLKIIDADNNIVEIERVIIPSISDLTLNAQYQIFLQQNNLPVKPDGLLPAKKLDLCYQPLISVIVPVYNVEPKWLDLCIGSVLNQSYQNWQLCLYDDSSTEAKTVDQLQSWTKRDDRIKIRFGKKNQGISLASNAAIKMVLGEFVALLDHDDELSCDALYEVVWALNQNKMLDFIYSDEDKIDQNNQFCDPHFKSDFNIDTLLSHNYICHFSVIRKSIGDNIGWFRAGFEGSQDHDLFLRVVRKTQNIHHIQKVLYHWRKIEGSTAIAISNKGYAQKAAKKAIRSYLKAENIDAMVVDGLFANSFRVIRHVNDSLLVSIIIPFRNQYSLLRACIESILNKTTYKNFEILLINNQSDENNVVDYACELARQYNNIFCYDFDHEFNYARLNNWAADKANGEVILFLNNDTEVINRGWLSALSEQVQREEVAAVGAKLLYADDTIQHAGIVVSSNAAVHVNKYLNSEAVGYFQRANYIQNISACTAACLMVKKSVFQQIGGFDEQLFKVAYNDVDLCLKIRQAGHWITYTPYARLYHYESKSRGLDDVPEKLARFSKELKHYQKKWGEEYKNGDPYYNPNLKSESEKVLLNIRAMEVNS